MKKIIWIFLLLFIGVNVNCFAVTEFVCTCNKVGEDYNTITLWEAAMDNATDLTDGTVKTGNWDNQVNSDIADAAVVTWDGGTSTGTLIHMTGTQYLIDVTGGTLADNDTISDGGGNTFDIAGVPDSVIITLELYDDDGDLSETGIVIDGFTTNATNYCKITVSVGERHDGTGSSGACINGGSAASDVFTIQDSYFQMEWVVIKNFGNGGGYKGIKIHNSGPTNGEIIIRNCIVYNGGDTDDDAISINGYSNCKIINCIGYDCGRAFITANLAAGETTFFYNCSAYGNAASGDSGFAKYASSMTCTNCTSFNSSPDFEDAGGVGSIILNNCISDDSTSDNFLGSNNLVDKVATDNYTNVTGGSEDLHLKAGADCIDVGQDLSGTFTDDIDGVTRDGTWDVGADEYVASGNGGSDDGTRNYFYSK